jgi:hypothetical protein
MPLLSTHGQLCSCSQICRQELEEESAEALLCALQSLDGQRLSAVLRRGAQLQPGTPEPPPEVTGIAPYIHHACHFEFCYYCQIPCVCARCTGSLPPHIHGHHPQVLNGLFEVLVYDELLQDREVCAAATACITHLCAMFDFEPSQQGGR